MGRISHFPIAFCMGLTTVQRDCAACDDNDNTGNKNSNDISVNENKHISNEEVLQQV